jgi:hypothetical protein
MRAALWLLALFGIAAAVALFAGNNQGTVTVFWPPYRVDLSLNLVLLLLLGAFLFIHAVLGALAALFDLPRQAPRCRTWSPAGSPGRASRPSRPSPRSSRSPRRDSARPTGRSCARWRTCWRPKARRPCRTARAGKNTSSWRWSRRRRRKHARVR